MKTLIILLLIVSNVLTLLHYTRLEISYKDDLTPEEKTMIHECLLDHHRRKLLLGEDAEEELQLIAKWEIVAGLEMPKR